MSEPTNEQRADRAYRLALIYAHSEGEDIEAAIVDLATDLLHLAPQYGLDADDVQRMSRHHYNAEVHEAQPVS